MCEHNFAYAGVRYKDGAQHLRGSGASRRYYAHVYYCTKCTETIGKPINDDDYDPKWNSYQKVEFQATPGTDNECGLPLEDR